MLENVRDQWPTDFSSSQSVPEKVSTYPKEGEDLKSKTTSTKDFEEENTQKNRTNKIETLYLGYLISSKKDLSTYQRENTLNKKELELDQEKIVFLKNLPKESDDSSEKDLTKKKEVQVQVQVQVQAQEQEQEQEQEQALEEITSSKDFKVLKGQELIDSLLSQYKSTYISSKEDQNSNTNLIIELKRIFTGITEGYSINLELSGLGYSSEMQHLTDWSDHDNIVQSSLPLGTKEEKKKSENTFSLPSKSLHQKQRRTGIKSLSQGLIKADGVKDLAFASKNGRKLLKDLKDDFKRFFMKNLLIKMDENIGEIYQDLRRCTPPLRGYKQKRTRAEKYLKKTYGEPKKQNSWSTYKEQNEKSLSKSLSTWNEELKKLEEGSMHKEPYQNKSQKETKTFLYTKVLGTKKLDKSLINNVKNDSNKVLIKKGLLRKYFVIKTLSEDLIKLDPLVRQTHQNLSLQNNLNFIKLNLGLSHPVLYAVPENHVTITTNQPFDSNTPGKDNKVSEASTRATQSNISTTNTITIFGICNATVKQIAANIYNLKKPEPYKGKGVRYDAEKLFMKPYKNA